MGQNGPPSLQFQGWEFSAWPRSMQTRADGSADSDEQRGWGTSHSGCICSIKHPWDCSRRPHRGKIVEKEVYLLNLGLLSPKEKAFPPSPRCGYVSRAISGSSSSPDCRALPGHCRAAQGNAEAVASQAQLLSV